MYCNNMLSRYVHMQYNYFPLKHKNRYRHMSIDIVHRKEYYIH